MHWHNKSESNNINEATEDIIYYPGAFCTFNKVCWVCWYSITISWCDLVKSGNMIVHHTMLTRKSNFILSIKAWKYCLFNLTSYSGSLYSLTFLYPSQAARNPPSGEYATPNIAPPCCKVRVSCRVSLFREKTWTFWSFCYNRNGRIYMYFVQINI